MGALCGPFPQERRDHLGACFRPAFDFRCGDAFETLGDARAIDLLVLDGWKALYLPLLKQLEAQLSPGCLIVADDTTLMPEMLAEYLAYVRDPAHGYISSAIPMDDGLELSIR